MADESRKSPPIAQGYEVTHEGASLASLSRLTEAESLLPITQGYEVTHEGARLWSLLWVRGGRKSLLSAWG